MEGQVPKTAVKVSRRRRESKYQFYIDALVASPDKALVVSLADEENIDQAAQRLTVTVRRLAQGLVEGKIRSKKDYKNKTVYLTVEKEKATDA